MKYSHKKSLKHNNMTIYKRNALIFIDNNLKYFTIGSILINQ